MRNTHNTTLNFVHLATKVSWIHISPTGFTIYQTIVHLPGHSAPKIQEWGRIKRTFRISLTEIWTMRIYMNLVYKQLNLIISMQHTLYKCNHTFPAVTTTPHSGICTHQSRGLRLYTDGWTCCSANFLATKQNLKVSWPKSGKKLPVFGGQVGVKNWGPFLKTVDVLWQKLGTVGIRELSGWGQVRPKPLWCNFVCLMMGSLVEQLNALISSFLICRQCWSVSKPRWKRNSLGIPELWSCSPVGMNEAY